MTLVLATDDSGGPEIFASLQGEGPSVGKPVAFMRLSRCNLACVWCDTAYTWNFDGDNRPHRSGETFDRAANQLKLSPGEAAERVASMGQDRLVITGGEPLMQAGKLAEMLEHLPDTAVEIETNGTVMPPARLDVRIDQYNVSPKLAHSGNPADLALKPDMLDHWASEPRAFLKFVIAEPGDVDEVLALAKRHDFDRSRVYLMPEGTDSETLRAREKWLAPLALRHGFRMTDRLHIHLYGDTRGT
ncbi:7-carboxy-7-deazaguanine synthase QueE [Aurantiacibacter sediminis]|uniref:7-carboxy-7-deazaguanine synthase n=1 Tax=Aurantiacibacter sediminis TaxID=2793064 RepID=A0ABS0N6J4_9SPHN|nr:7-carboxy-7-deazaguanine synthase QueE [Aurantiacibacter sediminis]MBH5323387.1 7-carboxy-7-deazaguanine synthase QueE [Aurantiacibacter sediminis]